MLTSFSPPLIGEARIAELVHAYLVAEYRWELDGHWFNLHIGQAPAELQLEFPAAHAFGLLSAWDPYSIQRPEPINRIADQMLSRDLISSGLPHRAAFSSASNRTWREPSWLLVDMDTLEFDAMSRRFGQLATLYWQASGVVRMRVDAARPAGFTDDDYIDWLK